MRRQETDTRRRALDAPIALLTAEFEEAEDKSEVGSCSRRSS